MKEALRNDGNCGVAGLVYYTEPAPAVTPTCSTIGVSGQTSDFSCHVCPSREEEQVISPPYTRIQLDDIYEGSKEEEAGEENALIGSHFAACAVWHVHWWRNAMSGFSLHLGVKGI